MRKVKIIYRGVELKVNEDTFKTSWNGKPMSPCFEIGRVEGASLIRQYIKKTFPSIKAWVTSDSFSMGNSIDVYMSETDGSKVDETIFQDIKNFAYSLQQGSFNGMIDMYENNEDDLYTSDGIRIKTYCKYVHAQNKPKFGTVEWGLNEMADDQYDDPNDIIYYIDKNKKEKFLEALS